MNSFFLKTFLMNQESIKYWLKVSLVGDHEMLLHTSEPMAAQLRMFPKIKVK